jgi:hypothetical protein
MNILLRKQFVVDANADAVLNLFDVVAGENN